MLTCSAPRRSFLRSVLQSPCRVRSAPVCPPPGALKWPTKSGPGCGKPFRSFGTLSGSWRRMLPRAVSAARSKTWIRQGGPCGNWSGLTPTACPRHSSGRSPPLNQVLDLNPRRVRQLLDDLLFRTDPAPSWSTPRRPPRRWRSGGEQRPDWVGGRAIIRRPVAAGIGVGHGGGGEDRGEGSAVGFDCHERRVRPQIKVLGVRPAVPE